jgi:hypothetical protein
MIDWKKIFSEEFFFHIDRIRLHRSDWLVVIIGSLFIIGGVITTVIRRSKQNPFTRQFLLQLTKVFLTIGLLELVWFGLRYEAVRWFGTHFTAVLIFAGGMVWIGVILKKYFQTHKSQTESWQKQQLKMKYLSQK